MRRLDGWIGLCECVCAQGFTYVITYMNILCLRGVCVFVCVRLKGRKGLPGLASKRKSFCSEGISIIPLEVCQSSFDSKLFG